MSSPTIAAIATGPAAGGVGIIRLSGPLSLVAARRIAPSLPAELQARKAYFTTLVDGDGRALDEALVLHFVGPHSFTGEDVVEVQTHGAPRLLKLLINLLISQGDVRLADPGEFTRRAFMNGRMDLARAEAVADLISAESDAAVRAAAAQLTGEFSERIEALRKPLVELAADVEAALDFPDESDEAADREDFTSRMQKALNSLRQLISAATTGALIRRSPKVVLYGPVNAGKSTLFNVLSGADRALVDAEAGTTRDVLESSIEIGGFQVTLVDTAGLREDAGRIEKLGITRARTALQGADIAVLIYPNEAFPQELNSWRSEVPEARRIDVIGKADLPQRSTWNSPFKVSGNTGAGVDELRAEIARRLSLEVGHAAGAISSRHVDALTRSFDALSTANDALKSNTLELVAGEIALCLNALGEITGQDATADVIDEIFKRFCIGK